MDLLNFFDGMFCTTPQGWVPYPPLSYVSFHLFPKLLPPFVTLLLSRPHEAERKPGSEVRVMNQRTLVGSNNGCVFVRDSVVL